MWRLKRADSVRANLARRQRLQLKLDKIALAQFNPSYNLWRPKTLQTSLILSSPHSGRHYPSEFLAQSTLSRTALRQCEDCYVDEIIQPLTKFGVPNLSALFPRIFVDLNRGADEWPPESLPNKIGVAVSPRARSGLGVVPTRTKPDMNIYPHRLSAELITQRLNALYHPYHTALVGLIGAAQQTFGRALLLDCHSMPGQNSAKTGGASRADIVLGNCYGQSSSPETLGYTEKVFTELGYKVMLNMPYAGGFITKHYGDPKNKIEAVQIEINKDLYLNADTLEPHAGMDKLKADMQAAFLHIKNYSDTPISLAAE